MSYGKLILRRTETISKRIGKLVVLIFFAITLILGFCECQALFEQNASQNETFLVSVSRQPALNDTELQAVLSDFEKYAEKSRKDGKCLAWP